MVNQYEAAHQERVKSGAARHRIDPSGSPMDVFADESPSEGASKQLMPQSDEEDLKQNRS